MTAQSPTWCATSAPPITPAISATLKPDIVIECTGAGAVVLDVMARTAPDGIVCLAGVSSGGRKIDFDIGDFNRSDGAGERRGVRLGQRQPPPLSRRRRRARQGRQAWLARLITRRVPLSRWREAFEHRDDDIKVGSSDVLDRECQHDKRASKTTH